MSDDVKDGTVKVSGDNLDEVLKEATDGIVKETQKEVPEEVTAMMERLKEVLKEVKATGKFRIFIMVDHAESHITGMMGTIADSEVANILMMRQLKSSMPMLASLLGGARPGNYRHENPEGSPVPEKDDDDAEGN